MKVDLFFFVGARALRELAFLWGGREADSRRG